MFQLFSLLVCPKAYGHKLTTRWEGAPHTTSENSKDDLNTYTTMASYLSAKHSLSLRVPHSSDSAHKVPLTSQLEKRTRVKWGPLCTIKGNLKQSYPDTIESVADDCSVLVNWTDQMAMDG